MKKILIITVCLTFSFSATSECVFDWNQMSSNSQTGNRAAVSACALLDVFTDNIRCGYTYIDTTTGEGCVPDADDLFNENDASAYADWVNSYHPGGTINWGAPVPPLWMFITQQDWENQQRSHGFTIPH